MKLEIQLKDYLTFTKVPPKEVTKKFLELSGKELEKTIKKETPVDNGKLRKSWKSNVTENRVTVSNSREYAIYVEKGTGIFGPRRHRIFPVNAKALHWTSKSSKKVSASNGTSYTATSSNGIFAKNIRGQPARHMAEKGLEQYTTRVPVVFHHAVTKTLKKG